MKNIVNKIIIWVTGITLVFVSLFSNINYSRKYQVQAWDQQSAIQAIALVISYLASSLISKGSDMTSSLIINEVRQFINTATGTETCETVVYGSCITQADIDELNQYVVDNPTASDSQSIVLPKAIANKYFDKAKVLSQAYLEQLNMEYGLLVYDDATQSRFRIPYQNGQPMFTTTQDGKIGFTDSSVGRSYYMIKNIPGSTFMFKLGRNVDATNNVFYRADYYVNTGGPFNRRSNGYAPSNTLPAIFDSADMVLLMVDGGSSEYNGLYLVPFWDNQSLSYSISKAILLNYSYIGTNPNATMVTPNIPISYRVTWDPLNMYFENDDLNSYLFTDYYELDDANFYDVPYMNVTDDDAAYALNQSTYPKPTPIPPEEEAQYVYNPGNGGTIPTVDIGTGMPTTPGIEQTNDPTLNVPLPGVDDLLDGTYFKDIAVWFSAWLAITISNITEFWNEAWDNLTLGINWLGISIKSLLDNMLNTLMYPMNLMLEGVNNIRDNTDKTNWFTDATAWLTGLFVPSDLDIKFTALMDFFNTKFGLLLYPFELIIDIVDRFMLVQGIDRISFYGYAEQTSGVTILPAFYIDIGDLRSQYEFLDYIFATIKMLVTTFFIFNFIRFLYYYYEDVRDS